MKNQKYYNNQKQIIVRGGGDLATAVIHRLTKAGYPVLVLETKYPAAIRRQVSFCEAVYEGKATIEGIEATLIASAEERFSVWEQGKVPILVDPDGVCIPKVDPFCVVDAIIAKRNLGTNRSMAPVTIGIGPGFEAGVDVHYVIESMRGHNLGRIYTKGCALPDTKTPGNIGGYTKERVIHAPSDGVIATLSQIGDVVETGQTIAVIKKDREEVPVYATIPGILRGMIRDGYPVSEGFKIADIDPRKEQLKNCFTISDKARCIAGSVLEIVCMAQNIDLIL